jgi:hypothetical protein
MTARDCSGERDQAEHQERSVHGLDQPEDPVGIPGRMREEQPAQDQGLQDE